MEFKTCPNYKECNGHGLFVIKCNSCPYYKGYKAGYAKAKKKYADKGGRVASVHFAILT
jgi:hypothetical protein